MHSLPVLVPDKVKSNALHWPNCSIILHGKYGLIELFRSPLKGHLQNTLIKWILIYDELTIAHEQNSGGKLLIKVDPKTIQPNWPFKHSAKKKMAP